MFFLWPIAALHLTQVLLPALRGEPGRTPHMRRMRRDALRSLRRQFDSLYLDLGGEA